MANVTKLPNPSSRVIDPVTGMISREWYRFFLNLYTLAGSGSNDISIDEVLLAVPSVWNDDDGSDKESPSWMMPVPEYDRDEFLRLFWETQLLGITASQEEQIRDVKNQIDLLPTFPVVGTLGHQNSDNVTITGGTISGITSLSVDGIGGVVVAYKTSDESLNSSVTLQDDDQLSVSLSASAIYDFRFKVFTNNVGALEGFKCALGGTVGVTSLKAQVFIFDDTTNALSGFARVTALASGVGSGLGTGDNYAVIEGTLETSTAGTLLLQWAQNVSGVNNTTVQRNSSLTVTRLS